MPHISMEYSANMESRTDMAAFCDHIRRVAIETGTFPMPGIRVRAFKADHASIADGSDKHGFIDISIRLRAGRPDDVKKQTTQVIFEAAKAFLEPAMAAHSVALSVEMRDIDPELSPKCGTIRDHLEDA
jgi:5-carboxymethyl-2-hydroxymuconate isomerase